MTAWVNVWGNARGGRSGFALVLLALCSGGCIDDFDHPEGYGTGGGGRSTTTQSGYDCAELCEESTQCSDEGAQSCASQCDLVENVVRASGCYESYQATLSCYEHASSVCSAQYGACDDEAGEFTTCIEDFCTDHYDECGGYY